MTNIQIILKKRKKDIIYEGYKKENSYEDKILLKNISNEIKKLKREENIEQHKQDL